MKTTLLITLMSIVLDVFFFYPMIGQDRYLSIVDKAVSKRNHYGAMTYDLDLRLKSFIEDDTINSSASVLLVRIPGDSLYGGRFFIDLDTVWYGYDGKTIVEAYSDLSTIMIADPIASPGLWVKSTWRDNFLDYGFLKQSPGPKAFMQDTSVQVVYSDTMIGDWPCIGIMMHLQDQGDFQRNRFFAAIDTIEYIVRSRMYSVFFQENEQYTNWVYNNVRFEESAEIERMKGDFSSAFDQIDYYSEDTTTAGTNTSPQYDFSLLTGKVYNKDEIFRLKDVQSRFTILDFWYTSCYPCIKSLPAVNEIHATYKNKGVAVYGVNMIDDEIVSKSRLEKFFKNNSVAYPTIMLPREMDQQIRIEGYPTLFVLDEQFNIVYTENGFSETLYEEVAAFLDERL